MKKDDKEAKKDRKKVAVMDLTVAEND